MEHTLRSSSSSSLSSSSPQSSGLSCEKKIRAIVKELQNTPMSVPLLAESGVGKALKKFIKKLHKFHELSGTDEEEKFFESSTTRLEKLLGGWKDMASANGVDMSRSNKASHRGSTLPQERLSSVSGQDRHTSNEQHTKDISLIQKCAQWRDLFHVLAEREQTLIRNHGAKMRKIRDNLEVGRPKIITASTKKRGVTKILREQGGIQALNNNPRKLGKLRQEFKERNVKIQGGRACIRTISTTLPCTSQQSSFGSSVSSAMNAGKKRSSPLSFASTKRSRLSDTVAMSSSTRTKRQVTLKDGKTMKLPKMNASLRGRRF
mmetsp:Transcript_10043/g.15048  ORF Transcript_10043/g.15048 Transcript_10043/m.15048 type:complete len:319 (-) Transcript_10043:137-1093(-)